MDARTAVRSLIEAKLHEATPYDQVIGVAMSHKTDRGREVWKVTTNGRIAGDSTGYPSRAHAVAAAKDRVAADPDYRTLHPDTEK
jgi:hypothetical protein